MGGQTNPLDGERTTLTQIARSRRLASALLNHIVLMHSLMVLIISTHPLLGDMGKGRTC